MSLDVSFSFSFILGDIATILLLNALLSAISYNKPDSSLIIASWQLRLGRNLIKFLDIFNEELWKSIKHAASHKHTPPEASAYSLYLLSVQKVFPV